MNHQTPLNGTTMPALAIAVNPHPNNPTQICSVTFVHGAVQASIVVTWADLPKMAQALLDGQKARPLLEVPRIGVPPNRAEKS